MKLIVTQDWHLYMQTGLAQAFISIFTKYTKRIVGFDFHSGGITEGT